MSVSADPAAVVDPPDDKAPALPRLLIVDDQPANIQALYEVFAADCQVYMATSGRQALQVCAAQRPDLLLLDVQMPEMDGYEVCRRLKADPLLSDIPIIFVTAHSDAASEAFGLELGAADFISKPFNPAVVRARVRTQLTLKAQSDLLRRQVFIDGLTGVYNRRFLDIQLAQEFGRAARQGESLSLALVDVDHFKLFNDRYGHLAGDDCLRQVARSLRQALRRPADVLCRFGGEEFLALLPCTDAAGAFTVGDALLQAVGRQVYHAADGGLHVPVSVSIGLATTQPSPGKDPAALLATADRQLYEAKSSGRARVCAGLC